MAFLGLDIVAGAKIVKSEQFGDWYRDPWGWPETTHEFAETLTFEDLGVSKSGKSYVYDATPNFHLFDVPKSFLGVRPAVIQDVRSRLAYTTAAAGLAVQLHTDLPDWVYGWRYRDGVYGKTNEWELYRESQADIHRQDFAAQTDVTSFFASIDVDRLIRRITDSVGGGNVLTDIVRRVLEAHNLLHGRSGIPQRSSASALLAHTALRQVDDLLGSLLQSGELTAARRWMDDISFEGPEPALYGALLQLQQSCRQEGLEVNALKTMLISGEQSAEGLREEAQGLIRLPVTTTRVTNDYEDFEMTFVDRGALREAEEQVLSSPSRTPRSKVGIVLKSLIRYDEYSRIDEWMAAAPYLPHAADKLSRYLAASNHSWWGIGLDLAKWFTELQQSGWPHVEWVQAQHALAVPSEQVDEGMQSILESWLSDSSNLQKVAVAVQRIAATHPVRYRALVAARIDSVHDPLLTRLLALGLLMAAQARDDVRQALRRHPSNALTLKYLEEKEWRLPDVPDDFDPIQDEREAEESESLP